MLPAVWYAQKQPKALIMWGVLFLFLFIIYTLFDVIANGSLSALITDVGTALFVMHLFVNGALALLTSSLMSLTHINLQLNKREPRGSNSIPAVAFLFALFTFGCGPCVVAFLAAFGIAFTPLVLGPGNLLWKAVLLLLVALAYLYILRSIHRTTCTVKRNPEHG